MKEDRERCLAAGMDDYAAKTIDPVELEQAIARSVPLPDAIDSPFESESPVHQRSFDPAILLARLGGDAKPRDEILDQGERELAGLLEDLAGAISKADGPRTSGTAHALKGALLSLTAKNAAEAVFNLEQMILEGNLGQAKNGFSSTGPRSPRPYGDLNATVWCKLAF